MNKYTFLSKFLLCLMSFLIFSVYLFIEVCFIDSKMHKFQVYTLIDFYVNICLLNQRIFHQIYTTASDEWAFKLLHILSNTIISTSNFSHSDWERDRAGDLFIVLCFSDE